MEVGSSVIKMRGHVMAAQPAAGLQSLRLSSVSDILDQSHDSECGKDLKLLNSCAKIESFQRSDETGKLLA